MKRTGSGSLPRQWRREIQESGQLGLPGQVWKDCGALWLSFEPVGGRGRDEVLEAQGGVSSSRRAGEGQRWVVSRKEAGIALGRKLSCCALEALGTSCCRATSGPF